MARGRRFCLLHHAGERAVVGAILFVHPFAEEMNKSRRMAALQARAFADAGWIVLQIDLYGCGDSEGDFGDATWKQWIDDVRDAAAWLHRETGRSPVLWGLRAGCLVALEASAGMEPMHNLLLWQPAISGKQTFQQFLRVEVASQMLGETGGPRAGTQQLREQLARGETIEVAGYALSPAMAAGMEAAELKPPTEPCRVVWLEISGRAATDLSPAARLRIDAWQRAGHRVRNESVEGMLFWQTQEISECPALIEATLDAVSEFR